MLRTLPLDGFTTIRDLMTADLEYNPVDLRAAIEAGVDRAPARAGGTTPPDLCPRRARRLQFDTGRSLAGRDQLLEIAAADGCDENGARVRTENSASADWFEFAANGGFSSPADDPAKTTCSREEMDALSLPHAISATR
ncbi:hypothetical protein [Nocardia cyriacigeorgica]|uniref:hypothetical protein n=1 Tax=Nocardia cyriacigeorgica TaxID=135487 RepID=UPI001032BA7A|nr:hypothetical protein [Nocardia cyriacigeorgica]